MNFLFYLSKILIFVNYTNTEKMKRFLFSIFMIISGLLLSQETHVHFASNVDAPLTTKEKLQFEQVYGKDATYVMQKPSLLKNLKDLIRNRVEVMELPYEKVQGVAEYMDAKDLTTIELYNVYNPSLTHDMQYSAQNFNILKYAINFFPQEREIYKLGNHYITILPQAKKERK